MSSADGAKRDGAARSAAEKYQDILRAYLLGRGKWRGCDWPAHLAEVSIKPEGLTSRQAFLAAGITRGTEANEWATLGCWLQQVENDSVKAEEHAGHALILAETGSLLEALRYAQQACALEARYPRQRVWQPLHDAIIQALMSEATAAHAEPLPAPAQSQRVLPGVESKN